MLFPTFAEAMAGILYQGCKYKKELLIYKMY